MPGTSLSRFVSLSLSLCAATFAGVPAIVAQQGSGTVPEEFVRAIVFDAELLIGALPGNIPAALAWPGEARVIGSVIYEDRSTSYVSVAADPEALVAFVRERMTANGWRTPPEREPPRGGFQRPLPESASVTFCGPADEFLSVGANPRTDDTLARVQFYERYPSTLPCDRPDRTAQRDDLQQRMPTLNLSLEEAGRNMTGGGGMDSRWSGAELRTDRSLAEIAGGIAEQVEAEGWAPRFSAEGEREAVRTWTRTFDDDARFRGLLLVNELQPGTYEAIFHIMKLPDR
jgi:hypothetical protein